MAVIHTEGFDKYGPTGTQFPAVTTSGTLAGEWTSASGGTISDPLSTFGNSINFVAGQGASRTLPGNIAHVIGGIRCSNLGSSSTSGVQFVDASTAQFSVTWNAPLGNFSIRTGGLAGTIIATSSQFVSFGSVQYLEWDVTVGAAGAYTVCLNGAVILSGTGNTRGGGVNNYVNSYSLGFGAGSQNFSVDDVYLFDSTGSTNNAMLQTNPVVNTKFSTGDHQTQFTGITAILGQSYRTVNTASSTGSGANVLILRKITPPANCTINSVTFETTASSATANYKAVIYSDSGGTPNSLLSSGIQLTGVVAGVLTTLSLVTPQSLTAATSYWIGLTTDTSVALQNADTTNLQFSRATSVTYGTPPSTAPAMTANFSNSVMWGNINGISSNDWLAFQNPPMTSPFSFISSSTVGNEDLYNFGALDYSPSAIHTVGVKAFLALSVTGPRTANIQTKSNTTDATGSASGFAPGTNQAWFASYFDVDPNTSAAWTSTGLNAAWSGIRVAT